MIKFNIKKFAILAIFSVLLSACGKDFIKYSPAKDNPIKGPERAKKNVEEGRGVSIGGITKRRGTNYEFSTSNPLWRASLEILDFLPMTMLITVEV